jgi:hypothetical protein
MPWVGFEPKIPASERAKTVHALDSSAILTGAFKVNLYYLKEKWQTAEITDVYKEVPRYYGNLVVAWDRLVEPFLLFNYDGLVNMAMVFQFHKM